MPKYIIEREIPGAGKLSAEELRTMARQSYEVVTALGPTIQWVQSYVVDDKVYCIYIAPNVEIILEHARRSGFPADRITEVRRVIDPTTAEHVLTEREVEVLRLASQGMTRRGIAGALCLSEATVRHHMEHIYEKIGTSTRVGAARYAMEQGLLH